ncbi:MAG TPA: hypothetical protein V6D16_02290 [Candidatus Obscuribacterales bacterium]
MNQYLNWAGATVLLSASVVAWSHPAIASTYRNSTDNTVVVLQETRSLSEKPGGYYFTKSAGRSWRGDIAISTKDAGAGQTLYTGTFQDQVMGPGTAMTCTGKIRIARQNPGVSNRIGAKVTWQITGGNGCPQVGQSVTLDLVESLPRPDRNGDFTPTHANRWMSETNGDITWLAWRVVSSDGKLNCRTSPNGSIKQVYTTRDRIEAETRGATGFTFSNGAPWMSTRQGCYVRANAQYLQPISIPF